MAQWFGGLIKLLGWLTGVTSKAGDGVKVFRERIAFLVKTIVVCTTAVVSYRAAIYLSTVTTKAAWQQTILYNAAQKASSPIIAIVKGVTLLLSAAKASLTGNTIRATAAMRAFNAVTKANPWGLLLGAITAVVSAIALFSKKQKELSGSTNESVNSFDKDKMETFYMALKGVYFTTQQIVQMVNVLSFDDNRLELAKAAYDSCVDRENYYKVVDAMTYSSTKEKLREYILKR